MAWGWQQPACPWRVQLRRPTSGGGTAVQALLPIVSVFERCRLTVHAAKCYANTCVEGEPPGERHGHAGRNYDGKPLKLLFVGDSIAVGVGAKIAAPLQAACAERLAKIQRRPVEWRTIAANGADVRELHALVDEDHSFDIAVVLCGVNDGKKFLQGL